MKQQVQGERQDPQEWDDGDVLAELVRSGAEQNGRDRRERHPQQRRAARLGCLRFWRWHRFRWHRGRDVTDRPGTASRNERERDQPDRPDDGLLAAREEWLHHQRIAQECKQRTDVGK
jgi:hypothetical protein